MSSAIPQPTARFPISKFLLWLGGGILLWFALSEGLTQGWYLWKESQKPPTEPWAINWPAEEDAAARGFLGFNERELSETEKELLRFQTGNAGNWHDSAGSAWTAFFIQWPNDKRLNEMDITHNPTVCLSGAGLTLVRKLPELTATAGDHDLRFHAWEFSGQGQTVFVYVATRWDRSFEMFSYRQGRLQMRMGNLIRVVDGNRGNALQTLELVVVGPRTPEAAAEALREQVGKLFGKS